MITVFVFVNVLSLKKLKFQTRTLKYGFLIILSMINSNDFNQFNEFNSKDLPNRVL